jgi:hypothetical protein
MRIGESSIGIDSGVGRSEAENKRAKDQTNADQILETSKNGSDVDVLLQNITSPQDLQPLYSELSLRYARATEEEMATLEPVLDKMKSRMKELKEVIKPSENLESTLEDNALQERRDREAETVKKVIELKRDIMKTVFDFYDVTPGFTGAENKMVQDVDRIIMHLQSLFDQMGHDNIQRFELRALADSVRGSLRNHLLKENGTGTFKNTGKGLVERHSANIEIDKAISSIDKFLSKIPLPNEKVSSPYPSPQDVQAPQQPDSPEQRENVG